MNSLCTRPLMRASRRTWKCGAAILVSVGYMDPANWGTDLAGGAQFKYGFLWVVALASFMAFMLQIVAPQFIHLGGRFGERDLRQRVRMALQAEPGGGGKQTAVTQNADRLGIAGAGQFGRVPDVA